METKENISTPGGVNFNVKFNFEDKHFQFVLSTVKRVGKAKTPWRAIAKEFQKSFGVVVDDAVKVCVKLKQNVHRPFRALPWSVSGTTAQ